MKNYRIFYQSLVPVVLAFSACTFSTEGSIQQVLRMNAEAPVFLDCRPISATEIAFSFSAPVRVVSLNFDPGLETGTIGEGREIKVSFEKPLDEGKRVTADILVEDSGRNTLNVIVPFRARNDRMPALVFNEFRTEYSKPRVEFVEFSALEAGNLGAMRLFVAGHSMTKPLYEFPPVEVRAGEYIVLHLRTIDEGCVDETGTDLGLSGGNEALDTARDFWIPGASKLLHRTGALWLMDQDDRIIDAVLFCENSTEWGKNNSAAAAEFLAENEAWLPDPANAVSTAGTTATRTICRDESIPPARRSANWYVSATSSATPGKPNNPKRYVP